MVLRRSLPAALWLAGAAVAAAPAFAASSASSSAFGESANFNFNPLSGGGVPISHGPLPQVSGNAPPAYSRRVVQRGDQFNNDAASTRVSSGLMIVTASSTVPVGDEADASAEVDNPGMSTGSVPLLTFSADKVTSTSQVGGGCGSGVAATGSSELSNSRLGGILVPGGKTLPVSQPPNTEVLNQGGVRVVVNEQSVTGDGTSTAAIAVNAVHVYYSNVVLPGAGVMSGEMVLAHSQAALDCNGLADSADLGTTLSASPDPVMVGQNLTYTITVSNRGPSAAPNAAVTDTLPGGVNLLSTTPSQGSCSSAAVVTCSLGTVAAGGTATVGLVVQPTRPGELVNTAVATSSVPDPNPGDNTATLTTEVLAPAAEAARCRVDDMPAATLLIPYFAVDLGSPRGRDTRLTVVNSAAAAQLASVTLWTDWAVPVLTFNVLLTGFGVETLDLRDILTSGQVPAIGGGPNQGFPGCDAGGVNRPARPAFLRRAFLGQPAMGGQCFASPRSTSVATGYVTVDAVNGCSSLNPANDGYFAGGGGGVASNANVLLGEYTTVDAAGDGERVESAVHIRADAAAFGAGAYTFYARYVGGSGSDNRQPLGTLFAGRFHAGGSAAGTQLVVWRDTKSPNAFPVRCGAQPSWAPLGAAPVTVWDDQENSSTLPASSDRLPAAVQVLTAGSAALPVVPAVGWLALDLSHGATPLFGNVAQGWVTVLDGGPGGPTTGRRAWRLDSACGAH